MTHISDGVSHVLAALLVNCMRAELQKKFRDVYVNNIGRCSGNDESLFRNKLERGGPARKRQRNMKYGLPQDPGTLARLVLSHTHAVEVQYRRDPEFAFRATQICRWWREVCRFRPTSNNVDADATLNEIPVSRGIIRYRGVPVVCPITLEAIPLGDSVKLVFTERHVTAYQCSSLVDYLQTAKKFKCPLTRMEINRSMVSRLRWRAIQLGIQAFDLLHVFDNCGEREINEATERNVGVERYCAGIFDRAVHLCDSQPGEFNSDGEVINIIEHDIIPEWIGGVSQLAQVDNSRCNTMLNVEKARLVELQQRAKVADPYNVIDYLIHRIDETRHSLINLPSNRRDEVVVTNGGSRRPPSGIWTHAGNRQRSRNASELQQQTAPDAISLRRPPTTFARFVQDAVTALGQEMESNQNWRARRQAPMTPQPSSRRIRVPVPQSPVRAHTFLEAVRQSILEVGREARSARQNQNRLRRR